MNVTQVRGTSGSGKSWVMRRVIEAIDGWTPVMVPPRRRALYSVAAYNGLSVAERV